jgi:outer membrane lipoprotein SlyB
MNTITPNNSGRSAGSSIHRGVWIGGGLMALTIIALATTLVVKSNSGSASSDTAAPLATTTGAPADSSSVAPAPVVVAQQAPAVQAPMQEPARTVHHAPAHHNEAGYNGNGPSGSSVANDQRVASVPVCTTCGVIDSYSAVQVQGQSNGVGAVAGGLGGALVGSKIAGRGNHTLGGAIGAVGGGLLGNVIEKHERTVTEYDVRVRMNDGSIRTVRQATVPAVGTRVNVDGHTLRPVDAQG